VKLEPDTAEVPMAGPGTERIFGFYT